MLKEEKVIIQLQQEKVGDHTAHNSLLLRDHLVFTDDVIHENTMTIPAGKVESSPPTIRLCTYVDRRHIRKIQQSMQ